MEDSYAPAPASWSTSFKVNIVCQCMDHSFKVSYIGCYTHIQFGMMLSAPHTTIPLPPHEASFHIIMFAAVLSTLGFYIL